mgnify:FL=1
MKRQIVVTPALGLENQSSSLVCYIDDDSNGRFNSFVGVGNETELIDYITPLLKSAVADVAQGLKPRVKITLEDSK